MTAAPDTDAGLVEREGDLLWRLAHPLWSHGFSGQPELDKEATQTDLNEAAARIASLSAEVERADARCASLAGDAIEWERRVLAAEARLASMEAEVAKWLKADHIQLHTGEMTAQELRSVKAVVSAIAAAIQSGEG